MLQEYNLDVLNIVEGWTTALDSDTVLAIPGYNFIRKDRGLLSGGRRFEYMLGGGIGSYIRDTFGYKVLEAPQISDINSTEYIIFEIIPPKSPKILSASIYRRKEGIVLNEFFEAFNRHVNSYSNLIISGDLNADLLDDRQSAFHSNHLRRLINENSLYNVPFGATHHNDDTETWLDVMFIDSEDRLINFIKSESPCINKHDLLVINYKLRHDQPSKVIKSRDFSNIDVQQLSLEIINVTNSILQNNSLNSNANSMIEDFQINVINILDKLAPFTTRVRKKPTLPWFTPELKQKCKDRDKLYKTAKRKNDRNILYMYKEKRREVKRELQEARDNYCKNLIEQAKDYSVIWSSLRRVGFVKQVNNSPLNFFSSSELIKFYNTVTTKHPPCSSETLNEILDEPVVSDLPQFEFRQFDYNEVYSVMVSCLSKSKGRSPDGLPLTYFRDFLFELVPFFTEVFNASIREGIYPNIWKKSVIIPLSKVSSPKSPSETRPVSNLSHFAKVFDKLIHQQLIAHLESNNIISRYQSGFRANYSTQTVLLKLLDDVRLGCKNKYVTILVLFDFKTAFDTINHETLLRCIKNLNFSKLVVKWFHGYLSKRSQAVVDLEGELSEFLENDTGVPQGSVLGPVIFLLFINLIITILKYCKGLLFADDLQIYLQCKIENINETVRKINEDVKAIVEWARTMGLILNIAKTKVIILGTCQNHMLLRDLLIDPIIVDGTPIPYEEEVKNLGVFISKNLTWNRQISHISSKIHGTLHKLRFYRNSLSINIRKLLVNALVIPHFDYACIVYDDLSGYLDIKLLRLLNVCTRFIFKLRYDASIIPYRQKLEWLTPAVRRKYFIGSFLYQLFKTNRPMYLRELFVDIDSEVRRSNRLNTTRFVLPPPSINTVENAFHIFASKFWFTLPESMRSAQSMPLFKDALFNYLLERNRLDERLYM